MESATDVLLKSWGVHTKSPFMRIVWIFPGTKQLNLVLDNTDGKVSGTNTEV